MKNLSENWLQSPHLAEVKLVYQTSKQLLSNPILDCPADIYTYLMDIWDLDKIEFQEEFCILLFNGAMRVLGWHKLSSGGKTATIVDPPHVLVLAALANASSVILCHNHPSGQLKASTADVHLTRRIHKTLQQVGISLHDHMIISKENFYSFKNHGLL